MLAYQHYHIVTDSHDAYSRTRRPPLMPRHHADRLEFVRDHVNWQLRHFRNVLFTNESKFCLHFHDGRRHMSEMNALRSVAYPNMTNFVVALLLFRRTFLSTAVQIFTCLLTAHLMQDVILTRFSELTSFHMLVQSTKN